MKVTSKRFSVTAALLAAFLLAVALMLPGCNGSEKKETAANPSQKTEQSANKKKEEPKDASKQVAEDTVHDTEWEFTDHAGRKVTIPATKDLVGHVYFTSPVSQIYTYTLAPDMAGGTNMEFTPYELKYLPKEAADLPYLGTKAGGKQLNPEAITAAGIKLIINIGPGKLTDSDTSSANDLQTQTGIPVVLLNGSMDNVEQVYTDLGEILGKQKEAAELVTYCQKVMKDVQDAVAKVPEDKRVSLYYAEGPEGLQTEPENSSHAATFKIAGAKNVADVEAKKGKGMSDVSLENVITWNPQVIIAWSNQIRGGADELIKTSKEWSTIDAVQHGRVYTMPNAPFSWCDRPPSVNRFLGIQWVANMLYPDAYDVDMVEVTKDFYKKFYHVEITDEDAKDLLGNSYPPYHAK